MRRWSLLLAFIVLTPVLVAEEGSLVARIIDNSTHRLPLQTVAPKYPHKARRDRIEGRVQVCFDIDRLGRTRRIAVRHSTNRTFERPSIRAVKASTFRPLGEDEALQAIKSCRTFVFSLEPVEEQAASSRRQQTNA